VNQSTNCRAIEQSKFEEWRRDAKQFCKKIITTADYTGNSGISENRDYDAEQRGWPSE